MSCLSWCLIAYVECSGAAFPDGLWLNPAAAFTKALSGGLLTLLPSLAADLLSSSGHTVAEDDRLSSGPSPGI